MNTQEGLPISPPAFWDGELRGGISWAKRTGPLGWVFLLIVLLDAVALVIGFSYAALPFSIGLIAGLGAVALAVAGLIAVLRAQLPPGRRPALSARTLLVAIAIAALTAVVCATRLPLLVRFDDARPQFTTLATTALARDSRHSDALDGSGPAARAGTFRVTHYRAVGGRVYFTVGSTGPMGQDNVFLVYSPVGTPTTVAGVRGADFRHLTGAWWTMVDTYASLSIGG